MKILTFDIEEWFHILDNSSTKNVESWNKYEVRIFENTDRILNFLSKKNLKATFFILGWIAEKYPAVVKKIDKLGHEIGSHTHYHQLMYEQNKSQVHFDLEKSIQTLENITGKKVTFFRAPGFSITEKNKWVFESLIENGITHDSSIFPTSRLHGGFPRFNNSTPTLINFKGAQLKEFPINTYSLLNQKIVYSGGGYFRICPYPLLRYFTKRSDYVMTYFHPRDFDSNQPMIHELPTRRKLKSYVGLKSSLRKLDKWTSDFQFFDLTTFDQTIDWGATQTFTI